MNIPPSQPTNLPQSTDHAQEAGDPLGAGQSPAAGYGQANVPSQRFYLKVTPPLVTRTLLALNFLAFIGMIVYGYLVYNTFNGTEDLCVLIDAGAKYNIDIKEQGQVWRLFTAMFLHIGVMHLLFNLYALNALGPLVEGYFGHIRFTAIYVIGGLFGSVASYAFSQAISAGASGAVFGLAGATTVYFLRYRNNFGERGRAILQNMAIVIGINLVFGLSVSGIDNWGHIGGLIGGAVVAWGLLPRYRRPEVFGIEPQPLAEESRPFMEAAWSILIIAVLVTFFQWAGTVTTAVDIQRALGGC